MPQTATLISVPLSNSHNQAQRNSSISLEGVDSDDDQVSTHWTLFALSVHLERWSNSLLQPKLRSALPGQLSTVPMVGAILPNDPWNDFETTCLRLENCCLVLLLKKWVDVSATEPEIFFITDIHLKPTLPRYHTQFEQRFECFIKVPLELLAQAKLKG